jgi:hypothetical protein
VIDSSSVHRATETRPWHDWDFIGGKSFTIFGS